MKLTGSGVRVLFNRASVASLKKWGRFPMSLFMERRRVFAQLPLYKWESCDGPTLRSISLQLLYAPWPILNTLFRRRGVTF